MEYKNGCCLLALSDGMGFGARAREESSFAVDILEQFFDAGFDKDTTVKLINSVLLLRGGGADLFTTLDICWLNLHSGDAEFIKIGAVES
ncbi:MAG: SpoIIE family protein phosphatase, partial [Clostridiales bacterium]|nr:SpoIIE family protein phosphatase [Clostridiales bacterium]